MRRKSQTPTQIASRLWTIRGIRARLNDQKRGNVSSPVIKAAAIPPHPKVKMLCIIYQTPQHEEVHRVENGFGRKLISEGKFTHTTKNKARSFYTQMSRLDAAGIAEVRSTFTLQL